MIAAFLLNNWKMIAIGLAVAGLLGYIGVIKMQRDHYKQKAADLQLVINQAKDREAALELGNQAITKKYQATLNEKNQQAQTLQQITEEKIKNDKELNRLRITANSVRLFNESKRNPATLSTTTVKGNDGETEGAATFKGISRPDNGVEEVPTVALAEVWKQVAQNDALHWKCVAQVETWQAFWKDFELNYVGAQQ